MQLNITTDYALRTLLCLEKTGKRSTAQQIADTMAIPERYVMKVLKRLKKAGYIIAVPGNQGGYELTKELRDIYISDILILMEPTVRINRCLEEDEYCSRNAVQTCPVRKFYVGLQSEIMKRIEKISLQDILESS